MGLAACAAPTARGEDATPPEPVSGEAEDPAARWASLREAAEARSWTADEIEAFVVALPKIETHLHLDGALRPGTIAALAEQQGHAPLLGLSEAQIVAATVVAEPREDLAAVLAAFDSIYPLLHTPEALERVAYDLVADAAAHNTRYVEVRFAPALQAVAETGFDERAVLEAVLAGLARGREDFGVDSRVIVCLIRTLPMEANAAMLDAAIATRERGVVGIDLAGDEAAVPLAAFAGLYRRAEAAGLHRTVHAGEVPESEDLALALELGVERIGHGKYLDAAPELFAEVVRRGVGLELNLSSNHRTAAVASIAAHPAKQWFDAGAAISVSTDDPGIFAITLTGEYRLLVEEQGFSPADLIELQRRTLSTVFLSEDARRELEARMLADIEALLRSA